MSNLSLGLLVAALTIGGSVGLSFLLSHYLSESSADGRLVPGILGVGTLVGAAFFLIVARSRSQNWQRAILICGVVAALTVVGSVGLGRVTYGRFGFTLYGAIPIPALDIVIRENGLLWFRNKTHLIRVQELEALADEGTELVLVGTGWYEAARVEDTAGRMSRVEVKVLSTPAAFAEYNRARARGRRVALIAHTTC